MYSDLRIVVTELALKELTRVSVDYDHRERVALRGDTACFYLGQMSSLLGYCRIKYRAESIQCPVNKDG